MHPIADLHTDIFKNFLEVIFPDPQNWGGVTPLPPQRTSTIPIIQNYGTFAPKNFHSREQNSNNFRTHAK